MANYVEKYESMVDKIMAEYKSKTDPARLERMAHVEMSKTDFYEQPENVRQHRLEQAKNKILAEHKADATLDIESALRTLQRDHQDELNRIERLKLRASTGRVSIADYAKANGLTEETAKEELDDYAKVKTSHYGDSVIDRYASIRNISRAEGKDQSKAHEHAKAEADRLGISEAVKDTEKANWLLSMQPGQVVKNWNSSGMAISRQLQDKSEG